MIKNVRLFGLSAILLAVTLSGCSGSGNDGVEAIATSLNLDKSVLTQGEETVVEVEFSFDATAVFDDHGTVGVLVKLPNGVGYHDGSAEIDQPTSADDSVGPIISVCSSTGETFLTFNLDENDLDFATNPSGNGDARLKFTITALNPTSGSSSIDARADDVTSFVCGQVLIPEISAAIAVQ